MPRHSPTPRAARVRRDGAITLGLLGVTLMTLGARRVSTIVHGSAQRLTAPGGTRARDRDLGPGWVHDVATRDGGRMSVHEYGDRAHPTVVLAHGLTNQWWIWTGVAEQLLADHHVVIPDLRGHGASDHGEHGMEMAAIGRDIADLLVGLDLHGVVLAGYSMGGMATLRFLVDHESLVSERVRGVALIATTAAVRGLGVRAGGAIRTSPWIAPSYRVQAVVPALKPAYGEAALWTVLLGSAAYSDEADGAAVDDLLSMHAESRAGVTALAMRAMSAQDLRDRLGRVRVPTTVVVGTDDVTIGPEHSRVLADGIPHATLVQVQGARHGIVLERPTVIAEVVRELVMREDS